MSSVIAVVVAACARPGGSEPASGTLVINLIGSAPDGNQYMLRNATITVTGPDSVQVFHTEDQLFRESLSANVPAGDYSALLDAGWRLERLVPFGSVEVNAELASDNPLQFTVDFGRTVVPLRFRTNIGEIDLSQGYDIVLDVEEVPVRGVAVSSLLLDTAADLAVFAPDASGDTPPLRTSSGLGEAAGMVVAGDDIIVADEFGAIDVFPREAGGGLSQPRRIAGFSTALQFPDAVAVYHGELYVTDLSSVLVFPLAADGDVPPTRFLDGISRSIESQIAIDRNTGDLYVLDGFAGVVRVYAASASGPATPIRTLGGPNTGLVSPSGVAIFFGLLFVSDEQTGDIRVFPLDAEGDTAPLRVLETAINGVGSLGHLSVTRDEIYVVNHLTDRVAVYPINAIGPTPSTRSFAGSTPSLPFHALGVAAF
ncbi:MAG TPA: hypothetical protein VK607_04305 [Kofleriaceae bacterium]|nr:hypothetical protein [Kofleriaceae bacterium]